MSQSQQFQQVLSPHCSFFPLRSDGTKASAVKYRNPSNRASTCSSSSYGVVIDSQFVYALDFDTKGWDMSVPEQKKNFDMFFIAVTNALGINPDDHLVVATANGGYHIYMRLPKGFVTFKTTWEKNHPGELADRRVVKLPKNKLSDYREALVDLLLESYCSHDVFAGVSMSDFVAGLPHDFVIDVREGNPATGMTYLVGAGSQVLDHNGELVTYSVINDGVDGIGVMSLSAMFALIGVADRGTDKMKQARKKFSRSLSADTQPVSDNSSTSGSNDSKTTGERSNRRVVSKRAKRAPGFAVTQKMRMAVAENGSSYHEKRAVVFKRMSCCYSDEQIASVCRELGVDHDTYRDSRISVQELMSDIARMRNKKFLVHAQGSHGSWCSRFRSVEPRKNVSSSPRLVDDNGVLVECLQFYSPSSSRVVSIAAVEKLLCEKTRRTTQKFSDAVKIVRTYVQPAVNLGVPEVLLSRVDMCKTLGFSVARASKAMELLRDTRVLSVSRYQRQGKSASYVIDRRVVDYKMTGMLRNLRYQHMIVDKYSRFSYVSYIFDDVSQSFMRLIDGVVVPANKTRGGRKHSVRHSEGIVAIYNARRLSKTERTLERCSGVVRDCQRRGHKKVRPVFAPRYARGAQSMNTGLCENQRLRRRGVGSVGAHSVFSGNTVFVNTSCGVDDRIVLVDGSIGVSGEKVTHVKREDFLCYSGDDPG